MGLMKAVEKFEYRRGLQVFHLRDVVDPPGDHPLDRRPGADHPHPGHMIETINKLSACRSSSCKSSAASRRRGRGRGNLPAGRARPAPFLRMARELPRRRSATGDDTTFGDFTRTSRRRNPSEMTAYAAQGKDLVTASTRSRARAPVLEQRFGLVDGYSPHAGGGRAASSASPASAIPPDRGQGAAQDAPPDPHPPPARLPRSRPGSRIGVGNRSP